MSANHGWRMSFSSTPTVRDRRSASSRAAALGRYPSSATARRTASRRAGLTLGEPRSTSDTSDLDTPARAATVSRVGLPVSRGANSLVPSASMFRALQATDPTAPVVNAPLSVSEVVCTDGAIRPAGTR